VTRRWWAIVAFATALGFYAIVVLRDGAVLGIAIAMLLLLAVPDRPP
jgi:hypothetical protein